MRRGRLHGFDKWVYYKLFDVKSYRGNLRFGIFACAFMYVGWHIYDFLAWWDSLWGVTSEINPGKQAWARLWAVIIGGVGIVTALACTIMIPINRRRAINSAEGQWYDDPALTREMLQADDAPVQPEAERKVRPETPETPAQWQQESTPTHQVVPTSVPDGLRNGLRIERRDGRITLVIPDAEAPVPGDVKKE